MRICARCSVAALMAILGGSAVASAAVIQNFDSVTGASATVNGFVGQFDPGAPGVYAFDGGGSITTVASGNAAAGVGGTGAAQLVITPGVGNSGWYVGLGTSGLALSGATLADFATTVDVSAPVSAGFEVQANFSNNAVVRFYSSGTGDFQTVGGALSDGSLTGTFDPTATLSSINVVLYPSGTGAGDEVRNVLIDNISASVAVVPEPAALGFGGLAALALRRPRR